MATAAVTTQKLNNGILALLKPAVEKVDAQVHRVRESQVLRFEMLHVFKNWLSSIAVKIIVLG